MSFSVKSTHKFVRPNQPSVPTEEFVYNDKGELVYNKEGINNQPLNRTNSAPRSSNKGSKSGMTISSTSTSLEDYY